MEDIDFIVNLVLLPVCIFAVLMMHELGHYWAARLCKISIDDFSVGAGRKLYSFRDKHGIQWIFNLFPINGHVHLSSKKAKKGTVLFSKAPAHHRAMVVFAGPFANICTAFLFLFLFFTIFGQPARTAEIAGVEPGQPAAIAGLKTGDVVIEVEGTPVKRYHDLWRYTYNRPGEPLALKVRRGENIFDTVLTPAPIEYHDEDGIKRSHGRMAVLIGVGMTDMKQVETINGVTVDLGGEDDETEEERQNRIRDAARRNLGELLGQNVSIGLKSTDQKTHIYETYLDPELNGHLKDPDHRYYNLFHAGYVKGNFYRELSMGGSAVAAFSQTGTFIKNIARLPFQIFPLDPELIRPWVVVSDSDDRSFALRKFYEFVYRFGLVSVFIAMLNLLPLPGLDGSMLLQIYMQRFMGIKDPVNDKQYKYILLVVLSTLYVGVVMMNIGDLPHYLLQKIGTRF